MTSDTVDAFVANRWADAKKVLTDLDSRFVERMETTHRLQTAGFVATSTWGDWRTPGKRLSKRWHRLLEACFDLCLQLKLLQVSADSLSASSFKELSTEEAGMRAVYHFRSWFIHAISLTEKCDTVIDRTVEAYVRDRKRSKLMKATLRKKVREQAKQNIEKQRNDFVHAGRGSWEIAPTEQQMWEGVVSIGMPPQSMLEESFWPSQGRRGMGGFFEPLFDHLTTELCRKLGRILSELESELEVEESN